MHCNNVSQLSVLLFKGETSGVSCCALVVSYPPRFGYHVHILFCDGSTWSPISLIGTRASRLTNGVGNPF